MENGENKEKNEEGEKKGADQVVLSSEQYGGLLDRIAELEALSVKGPSGRREEVTDVDSLVEEARPRRREVREEEEEKTSDLEQLSNTQLANFILSKVNEAGRQLITEVQTLKVLREIDKCEAKYDDFWEHEKSVYEISTKNPTLTIEQAYKLAKTQAQEKKEANKGKEKEGEEGLTRTERMLKLPPRVSSGEKPGVAASTVRVGDVKTVKDAALKAWDEAVGKGKTTIE